ncbi:hypothetical protein [Levilactobacillus brevis]
MNSSDYDVKLDKIRVPFLCTTSEMDKSKLKNIEEFVERVQIQQDKTVVAMSASSDTETNQITVLTNFCYSLDRMVVIGKIAVVFSIIGNDIELNEIMDDVVKENYSVSLNKIKQLISVSTEQLVGYPQSIELSDKNEVK